EWQAPAEFRALLARRFGRDAHVRGDSGPTRPEPPFSAVRSRARGHSCGDSEHIRYGWRATIARRSPHLLILGAVCTRRSTCADMRAVDAPTIPSSWWARGLLFENCSCTLVCPGHLHFSQNCTK